MKKLVIIAILLILAGCDAFIEREWVKRNVENLIAERGTPNQIKLDGLVKKIYIYYDNTTNTPSDTTAAQDNEPIKVQKNTKATLFWIDRKGKITKVRQKTIRIEKNL